MNDSPRQVQPPAAMPANPTPSDSGEGQSVELVRRRALLLKAAAGSAPLMAGFLPGAARAVAAGSAYAAAYRDAQYTPSLSVANPDGWMRDRVRKGRLRYDTGSEVVVWEIGGAYYDQYGTQKTGGTFIHDGDVHVLALFNSSTNYSAHALYPQQQRVSGWQGLHCSSWTSIYGGAAPYSCDGS